MYNLVQQFGTYQVQLLKPRAPAPTPVSKVVGVGAGQVEAPGYGPGAVAIKQPKPHVGGALEQNEL